jgi:hypothetical protein
MVTIITSPGAFTAIVNETERGAFAKVFAPKAEIPFAKMSFPSGADVVNWVKETINSKSKA